MSMPGRGAVRPGRAHPALTFLGAVDTVTGSRFLLEAGDTRMLVEAGLYQGLASHRRRNWEAFPVDPSTLDHVLLTHAHLDHSGYLPRLVKDGFRGRVVCTPETAELAAIVLHAAQSGAQLLAMGGYGHRRWREFLLGGTTRTVLAQARLPVLFSH